MAVIDGEIITCGGTKFKTVVVNENYTKYVPVDDASWFMRSMWIQFGWGNDMKNWIWDKPRLEAALKTAESNRESITLETTMEVIKSYLGDKYVIVPIELPEEPGKLYDQGCYSRDNHHAMLEDLFANDGLNLRPSE